jgi:hypothetical protein
MAKKKEVETKLVQEGDIIILKQGHTVYIQLPEHFVFFNRRGVFDKLTTATVKIGHSNDCGLDTDFLVGRYIVVRTAMTGGGTGHGPHDVFPDGWSVTARMVGRMHQEVSFYQSGCFTAMNEEVEVVGKAKQKWEV